MNKEEQENIKELIITLKSTVLATNPSEITVTEVVPAYSFDPANGKGDNLILGKVVQ